MTKITSVQALFPVALLSFVMTLFLGFQTSMMMSDRTVLQDTIKQQQQPMEQAGQAEVEVVPRQVRAGQDVLVHLIPFFQTADGTVDQVPFGRWYMLTPEGVRFQG